ncbi:hypothetical protein Glove_326g138 [Diversispora epigaea]|uniref:Uncharacterized protein n=1 Tax=Diversispora epigaea TaxID=1348612 RepID=A0A397HU60_9GLOM|nr:hypothetical protein Glove_326g138 [Diversispora epigaea]
MNGDDDDDDDNGNGNVWKKINEQIRKFSRFVWNVHNIHNTCRQLLNTIRNRCHSIGVSDNVVFCVTTSRF